MDKFNVLYLREDAQGWRLDATLTLGHLISFDAAMDVIRGLQLPKTDPERAFCLQRALPRTNVSVESLGSWTKIAHAHHSKGSLGVVRFLSGSQEVLLDAAFNLATWLGLPLEIP